MYWRQQIVEPLCQWHEAPLGMILVVVLCIVAYRIDKGASLFRPGCVACLAAGLLQGVALLVAGKGVSVSAPCVIVLSATLGLLSMVLDDIYTSWWSSLFAGIAIAIVYGARGLAVALTK